MNSVKTTPSLFFQPGGSLFPDAPSYIERAADRELLEALEAGECCYILDARQVGKSSLCVRAMKLLQERGTRVVALDLSVYGQHVSIEQWYFNMLTEIGEQLQCEEELFACWQSHSHLGYLYRWVTAIQEILLAEGASPAVLFVDELDAVQSLPFSADEFFAAIRECYNRRTRDPRFQNLTFCLVGVIRPERLIQNPLTTPFNIGRRIALNDFELEEILPLAQGLSGSLSARHALLRRVHHWTGGHPYLTQRLCAELAKSEASPKEVDSLYRQLWANPHARYEDSNLSSVRQRLLYEEASVADVLDLLRRIALRRPPVIYDATNPHMATLLLSGVARVFPEGGKGVLRFRNRIYAHAFDRLWIEESLPDAELRRQRAAVRRALVRVSLIWSGVVCILAIAGGLYYQNRLVKEDAFQANSRATKAQGDYLKAEQATRKLRQERLRVEREKKAAEAATALAQSSQTLAEGKFNLAKQETSVLRQVKSGLERKIQGDRASIQQNARAITEQMGILADAYGKQPGQEAEGLKYALRSMSAARRQGSPVPPIAIQGLATTLSSGLMRRLQLKHPMPVTCATFSPDGTRILTAGIGEYAYVWDAATGRCLQKLRAQPHQKGRQNIHVAEYSSDGTRILTTSDTTGIMIWDSKDRRPLLEHPVLEIPRSASQNAVNARNLNASFGGRSANVLASSSEVQNGLYSPLIWDLKTLTFRRMQGGHVGSIYSVAFGDDDKKLVSTGAEGTVKVWDVESGRLLANFDGHLSGLQAFGTGYFMDRVYCAKIHRFGDTVYSSAQNGSVYAWNLRNATAQEDGNHVKQFHRSNIAFQYTGHNQGVWSLASSNDGFWLGSAGEDGIARIWNNTATMRPMYTLPRREGAIYAISFDEKTHHVVVAGADKVAEVWELTLPVFSGVSGPIRSLDFSEKRHEMAVGSDEWNALGWDWELPNDWRAWTRYGHRAGVNAVCYSPDGERLASGSEDGLLWITRLPRKDVAKIITAKPEVEFQFTNAPVRSLAYSPDGKSLLSADERGNVLLWDIAKRRLARSFVGHTQSVRRAVFSPDGERVASASADGTCCIWQTKTGRLIQRIGKVNARYHGGIYSVSFSPKDEYLLLANPNDVATLWDTKNWKQVALLQEHSREVLAACFSRNGDEIATVSADHTLRLWRISDAVAAYRKNASGASYVTYRSLVYEPMTMQFSPDKKWIAVAGREGMVHFLPATVEAMIAKAKALLKSRPPEDNSPQ